MPEQRQLPNQDAWGELYPFRPNYFELSDSFSSGCRCHYLDEYSEKCPAAETRCLLFVHGNPTWSFHWRQLIVSLRGQYRCVAPDHLGCGKSDLQPRPLSLADHIDNLLSLVEWLDLRRVTLVAQDWGGAIGLGCALRASDRFERVALLNTGAFPPWFIPWRIRVCRWPLVGKLAVQGANAFSRAALKMTTTRKERLDPREEQAYLAPYSDWSHRAAVYQFVRDIPLSPRHRTWQTLEQIEAGLPELGRLPIQLIWGMQDWCFTPECLERFMQHWPQAEVHRLADVGHWAVEDAPEFVESLLADWLRRSEEALT